jgi:hypothetical protein
VAAAPVLHAVFDASASGCLKQALGRGRRDGVIWLSDDLSIGPIDRTDGEARTRWMQEQFGVDAFEESANIDAFWSDVASRDNHIIAWVSRHDVTEHAGLLELLRQRGEAPLDVVDITDVEFAGLEDRPDPAPALGIASLAPAQDIERKLRESAAPMSASARLSYAENWARLRRENAVLRIVENLTLVSAPVTHFDARIVSFATPDWQSVARILGPFYSTARAEGFNAPDLRFVLSRVTALVESGQLEGDGDLSTLDGHSRSRVRCAHGR